MKSKKRMAQADLVQEINLQATSRCTPSVALIKKCLETLVDKQYLERVEASDFFVYLA